MYIRRLFAISALFLSSTPDIPIALAITDGKIFSEAGQPISFDNEQDISRLRREFDASQQENSVEIDFQPEKAPLVKKPILPKGQHEFVTFIGPAALQSELKRTPLNQYEDLHQQMSESFTGVINVVFLSVVTVCSLAAVVGIFVVGVFWQRLHKQHLAAQEAEYPQYGVIGPAKDRKSKWQNDDESMAYKAQLHHYQQTKQKIIGSDDGGTGGHHNESDDSDHEEDEGDYSVYECPGLAPTCDIEVSNPMFVSSPEKKITDED